MRRLSPAFLPLLVLLAALSTFVAASKAAAIDATLLKEGVNSDIAGSPCALAVSTNGTAANLRWYNFCSGYIWIFSGLEEGEGVGVRFGGAAQPAVNDQNRVKRAITYFRNVIPNYNFTVDLHVDIDANADGCPDATYLSDLNLDPGLRWNCSEFDAAIPTGTTSLIVRTVHDGGVAPNFATDGALDAACDPIGIARSYYYGINGSACVPWDGPTSRNDNFPYWLIIDATPTNEACCFTDGSCDDLLAAECTTLGGAPQGPGTSCAAIECPQAEACCQSDGTCSDQLTTACSAAGGVPQGAGTTCLTVSCAPPEACCLADGLCIDRTTSACIALGGVPQGSGSACATTNCPEAEACCLPDGSCIDRPAGQCAAVGGVPQGPGSSCATVSCATPPQACCFANGACSNLPPADCAQAGGAPQGPGTICGLASCTPQACCFGDGSCIDLPAGTCQDAGGVPRDGSCSAQPCVATSTEPTSWGRIKGLYR